MTKNDLLADFVDAIERARGRINDPIAARNKSLLSRPLAAQGSQHIALWETENFFTKRQDIKPPIDVSDTSDLFRVYTRDLNNLGFLIDYLGTVASSGYTFYPSGIMGSGFGLILSAAPLTANRIIKFPNVNGNVMVAAGAVDLTGKTTTIGVTQILSLANIPVGFYLVTAEVMCTTAGSGSLAVNILETDNVGAFTDPIINGFSMAATGRTQTTKGYRVTGAATLRYSVTGTFTGTYALYIRVNSLS